MNLRNPKIQFMDSRVVEGATYAELDKGQLEFTLVTSGRRY